MNHKYNIVSVEAENLSWLIELLTEMKTIWFLIRSFEGAHGTEKLINNLNISFIFISIAA